MLFVVALLNLDKFKVHCHHEVLLPWLIAVMLSVPHSLVFKSSAVPFTIKIHVLGLSVPVDVWDHVIQPKYSYSPSSTWWFISVSSPVSLPCNRVKMLLLVFFTIVY